VVNKTLPILILASIGVSGCLIRAPSNPGASSTNSPVMNFVGQNCLVKTSRTEASASVPLGYYTTGQPAAGMITTSKIGQSFKINTDGTYPLIVDLALLKIGRPSGNLFIALETNTPGLPDGGATAQQVSPSADFDGKPSGNVLAGIHYHAEDLLMDNTSDNSHNTRISYLHLTLDQGTLSMNSPAATRSIATNQNSQIHLAVDPKTHVGKYWITVQYQGNDSSNFIFWLANNSNLYQNGRALTLISNSVTSGLWTLTQVGVNRDMAFSFGCQN